MGKFHHTIACRTSTFGGAEAGFPALAAAGVLNAEVSFPADGDYAKLKQMADATGMTISTLGGPCDLDDSGSRETFQAAIMGAGAIGTPRIFVSLKSNDPLGGDSLKALRDLLQIAADQAVTLCFETHPPYGTNAGTALRTVEAVNHPNLRFNFDTGNIYYYNHGLNSVDQLRYCRDIVGSVHLKDTNGGFEDMDFPIMGQGVVDYPTIFKLLDEIGFDGPYTMELEGKSLNEHSAGRQDFLARCVAYLQEIGA